MEYKNENCTPLDGADEELLRSILGCAPGMMPFPTPPSPCAASRKASCSRAEIKMSRAEMDGAIPDTDCTLPEAGSAPCGCGCCEDFHAPELSGVPLSMVYSPYQKWENIYECEVGFKRGTIFKCLDFPFDHSGCDSSCKTRP